MRADIGHRMHESRGEHGILFEQFWFDPVAGERIESLRRNVFEGRQYEIML